MYMKNKILLLFVILLLISTGCFNKKTKKEETNNLNIVTSLEDNLSNDTVWCGSFNIVWNELKENAKSEITVSPEQEQIVNLNKSTFTKDMINENSYYVTHGKLKPSLKKEIEKDIKEKFNQKSDILDNFNWDENSDDDLYYAMMYKKFNFKTPFKELEKSTFNDKGEYKYFGINKETKVGAEQVTVLYYEDKDNFAVKLTTKENDEVILLKNSNKENSFLDYYNKLVLKSEEFNGKKYLENNDTLYVPYIKFNVYKEFDNLRGILVEYKNGETYKIEKAVQSIKLELNESGGEIKSESGIDTRVTSAIDENTPRYFNYTSDFILFLKEDDKSLPYFAANINSLDNFQN